MQRRGRVVGDHGGGAPIAEGVRGWPTGEEGHGRGVGAGVDVAEVEETLAREGFGVWTV